MSDYAFLRALPSGGYDQGRQQLLKDLGSALATFENRGVLNAKEQAELNVGTAFYTGDVAVRNAAVNAGL